MEVEIIKWAPGFAGMFIVVWAVIHLTKQHRIERKEREESWQKFLEMRDDSWQQFATAQQEANDIVIGHASNNIDEQTKQVRELTGAIGELTSYMGEHDADAVNRANRIIMCLKELDKKMEIMRNLDV